jgi:ribosomal protein S18 acetylase RimI-like enzyme
MPSSAGRGAYDSLPVVPAILEIETLAFRAWPAAECVSLGGWRLRATGGVTRRGNSVWPGAACGRPLGEAVAAAEEFYAARRAPARFQLFPGAEPAELDAALARRGYAVETPVSVQSAETAELAQAADPASGFETAAAGACTPEWWSIAGERSRFADVAEVYRALLERIGPRAGYVLARRGGAPVATALGVSDGDWAGIFSMLTLPEWRGRGAGRALLGALARWAGARGARRLYLQVERDNAAALALYAGAGFRERYGYHYRLLATR